MATLALLDDLGELASSRLAGYLGRSPSATSRLVDQLVKRGWVARREDAGDRRVKRVALEPAGRDFLARFERRRAEAQLGVMAALTPAERARVLDAMRLLAEAARRPRP
jgi:DNA-binding MarR family transcriptional regulator